MASESEFTWISINFSKRIKDIKQSSSLVTMVNYFYRIGFCLMLFTYFFLPCEAMGYCKDSSGTRSLSTVWSSYGGCKCGNKYGYRDNCAHYVSNALILGGYCELDGGTGYEMRDVNGFNVCSAGRPIRAKELRNWFGRVWKKHSSPREGINLVYQEKGGQGHVLLKKYIRSRVGLILIGFRGTGNFYYWPIQEYYY